MLNQNPKPYFNQVAMIESQYESKRRNLASSNNGSLLQNKSPMRERQNTNSINTPSRLQAQTGQKVSLSPIRSRRNQQPTSSVRSTAISRKKNTQNYCQNHGNKVAKFMIDKENQQFYFCDKCAIPLISNGFKLVKINQQQGKQAQNPRIQQINQFLKHLQVMDSNLNKKKQSINQVLMKGQGELNSEIQKIQQFYAQFYEIIDQHKRRVIEEIKGQFDKTSKSTIVCKQQVEQAIKVSLNMRQDIISSMNSVILEVMDHEFRQVMNQYYENLEGYKQICNLKQQQSIKVRTLTFRDAQIVCQNLIDGLVIEWNDEQGQVDDQSNGTQTKMNQIQYQRPRREQQQSDRQNPIECLQTEERKSKTKQLNGLFCSFDE